MRLGTWVALVLLAVLAAFACVGVQALRSGIGARGRPTAAETWVARRLRHLAVPRTGSDRRNPVPDSPQAIAMGKEHFADHCATCHGNDGRGRAEIGRSLYPPTPDMTAPGTQTLSDGELFYIIKNGVRFTGMPAWGNDTPEDDRMSWTLVRFIRHLPGLTPAEEKEMEDLNPKTPDEREEEETEKRFLEGKDVH